MPHAVLFDMDGTLVDSELVWEEAERSVAEDFELEWTRQDARACFGRPLTFTAQSLIDRGVPLSEAEAIERMVAYVAQRHTHSVGWLPGAEVLLADLAESGVPCALVTMSPRRLAEVVARHAPGAAIRAVVSHDDVANGKPHPEPYRTAAHRLGVAPSACVVIEDSINGAMSGLAAGARVLSVPSSAADVAGLVDLGCVIARSLTEVTVQSLRDLRLG